MSRVVRTARRRLEQFPAICYIAATARESALASTITPLIAGNWKMHGLQKPGLAQIEALSKLVARTRGLKAEVLLCLPFTLLPAACERLKRGRVAVGGQDCHAVPSGAHTGDISAEMLADAGCRYVICGHSERRADHHETDKVVRRKAEAAHRAGLTAIVCVGETLEQRQAGEAERVVGAQLTGSLPRDSTAANTVVAYEPVWAIGTGVTPTVADVAAMHDYIRGRLRRRLTHEGARLRLLYGGSVKPDNAAPLLAASNVNGALVGGASLKAADLFAIVEALP
jgi:triosephosphate isomerase